MQRIVCFGFYIFYLTILSAAKHKVKIFMKPAILHSGNLYVKSEYLHDRNTFGGKIYFGFDKSVFIKYFHYATC